ncbi:MAG: lipid-A-disaccharide synthase N-terminal domain-containing protein [Candidatus Omnitrophica bacterium]|nr:lipid-A-disaccharide synthase N-terminal domain-containing protein [Candidatus Omnitrophota bacterium]
MKAEIFWVAIGLLGQFLFFLRFFFQWLATEKKKESTIPVSFWYFSIFGGIILFVYACYRKDPVFILGQALGVFIYARNLYFIYKKKKD